MAKNDFNLWIFTHEIFQQSILNISFRQFQTDLNVTSDAIYVDHLVEILIHITPATTYQGNKNDFYGYWEQGLPYIMVNFSLLSQNHPIPMKTIPNPNESTDQSLRIYRNDRNKNTFILSTLTTISIDKKYLSIPKFQLKLSFGLNQHVSEYDLPFNEQLISNPKEKHIRILMDRNRYVPSNLPSRYVETQVMLARLLIATATATTLSATTSLLTFTLLNTHPTMPLLLHEFELFPHYVQTAQDNLRICVTGAESGNKTGEEVWDTVDLAAGPETGETDTVPRGLGPRVIPVVYLPCGGVTGSDTSNDTGITGKLVCPKARHRLVYRVEEMEHCVDSVCMLPYSVTYYPGGCSGPRTVLQETVSYSTS